MTTPEILIIEGPDGVGKTTYIKNYVAELAQTEPDTDVIVIRAPDNRDSVVTRQIIMSEEIRDNPSAAMYLFLADFMYAFDKYIKNAVYTRKTILLFDRFIPSLCVYQKVPAGLLSIIIHMTNPEFAEAFGAARYHYLMPADFDTHRLRLAKKHGDELNHLDPKTDDAIADQIEDYYNLIRWQRNNGLVGSAYLEITYVS